MLDSPVRRLVAAPLNRLASPFVGRVSPNQLTAIGWLVGVGACVAVAQSWWIVGLVLWLLNRLVDGLDGPLARRVGATEWGGFLDIVADFSIYAGLVLAIAIAEPGARLACVALMVAYYLNGTAFLALSGAIEKRRSSEFSDGRTYRFVGGLAEGTETVLAYVVFLLLPDYLEQLVWGFAVIVTITAVQRVVEARRLLTQPTGGFA